MNLLIIGGRCVGKSTLCNVVMNDSDQILDKPSPLNHDKQVVQSNQFQYERFIKNEGLFIVDTISWDMDNTTTENDKYMSDKVAPFIENLIVCLQNCRIPYHHVFYVIDKTTVLNEHIYPKVKLIFDHCIGKKLYENCSLIITHSDTSYEQWLIENSNNSVLRYLQERCFNTIPIDFKYTLYDPHKLNNEREFIHSESLQKIREILTLQQKIPKRLKLVTFFHDDGIDDSTINQLIQQAYDIQHTSIAVVLLAKSLCF